MSDVQGTSPVGSTTSHARFDALVVPEIPVLWRAAYAITRDAFEAEDLVQDTLLRAYRFLDNFDGRHIRAWLLTILRNTHVNRNRRRRPSLLRSGDVPETASPKTPSAEDETVRDQFNGAIDAALQSLSPKYARVVELVDIAGLTYEEAAAALGVPKGTVMSRLHRARRQLRRALEPKFAREGESS
jgi:RNA polymerase sigma-70 factor (ECF subfamily)